MAKVPGPGPCWLLGPLCWSRGDETPCEDWSYSSPSLGSGSSAVPCSGAGRLRGQGLETHRHTRVPWRSELSAIGVVSRPAGLQLRAGPAGALTLALSGSLHPGVPLPSPAPSLGWVVMTSVQHVRQGYRVDETVRTGPRRKGGDRRSCHSPPCPPSRRPAGSRRGAPCRSLSVGAERWAGRGLCLWDPGGRLRWAFPSRAFPGHSPVSPTAGRREKTGC